MKIKNTITLKTGMRFAQQMTLMKAAAYSATTQHPAVYATNANAETAHITLMIEKRKKDSA
jgi:hypothetical protein